jgi:transcriptional regulator with XRE-family HTH domain
MSGSLAQLLLELKERDGRSYEALARRTGVGRSTLHRYCTGGSVPGTFGVVERVGLVCGADRGELAELHRRWLLARRPAGAPVPAPPGRRRRPRFPRWVRRGVGRTTFRAEGGLLERGTGG